MDWDSDDDGDDTYNYNDDADGGGGVFFGSDCQVALYYIFDQNKTATATTNSFHLIMATRKVLDRLPIRGRKP
jgi:hypothetical protein